MCKVLVLSEECDGTEHILSFKLTAPVTLLVSPINDIKLVVVIALCASSSPRKLADVGPKLSPVEPKVNGEVKL